MFARGWDRRSCACHLRAAGREVSGAWRRSCIPRRIRNTFTAPNMPLPDGQPDRVQRPHSAHLHRRRQRIVGTGPTFRIALHHDGTDSDADAFARDTEKIVRETGPSSASSRSSRTTPIRSCRTICPGRTATAWSIATAPCSRATVRCAIPAGGTGILGTVAHEFFHSWNMERIRAKAIEPFNFEDANVSGELWMGEGFTSYYDELIMRRSGLSSQDQTLGELSPA